MTLVAIKLPIGAGGAPVEYRLGEHDRAVGTRIVERGRRGATTACGRCEQPIPRRDLRVVHPTEGPLCLTCAAALGALVKVVSADG